jgi:formylglycine-generating enzyme required for sulfatase activity
MSRNNATSPWNPRGSIRLAIIMLALLGGVHQAAAQEARFFRIMGPTATTITAFNPNGTLVWSNAQPGATYTVQTVSSLQFGANWADYVHIPVTNGVLTNLLVDFNSPCGMALIPTGSFTIGDTLDRESDAVPTNVYVSAFYMETNLVTWSEWLSAYAYATNHGYGIDNGGYGEGTNYPVEGVDWYAVVKWCNARSQQAGLTPVYYTDANWKQVYTNGDVPPFVNWGASGYRLPTEAEWEKAARGGLIGQRFPWGDTITENQANYFAGSGGYDLGPYAGFNTNFDGGVPWTDQATFTGDNASPVGFFAPNGYGVYDMTGNVLEWCWDWYATPYGQPTVNNPTGPAGPLTARVLRGGNWLNYAVDARCAFRWNASANEYYVAVGFRCVKGN